MDLPTRRAKKQARRCAQTVQESNVFMSLGIALSEKQIPRFIGNVGS